MHIVGNKNELEFIPQLLVSKQIDTLDIGFRF